MGIWDSSNGPIKDAEVVLDNHSKQVSENVDVNAKSEFVKTEPVVPTVKPEFKGLPVRVSGDRIWLLKGGKKAWITNKETFEKLGFRFGDEREIDFETLQALPEGEPLR